MKGTIFFVLLAIAVATCQDVLHKKKSKSDILNQAKSIIPAPDPFLKEPYEDVDIHTQIRGAATFNAVAPNRQVVAVKRKPKGGHIQRHSDHRPSHLDHRPSHLDHRPTEVIPTKEETHHSAVASKPAPKHLPRQESSRRAVVLPASSVREQQPARAQEAFFVSPQHVPPQHSPSGAAFGGLPVVPLDIPDTPLPPKKPTVQSAPAGRPKMQTVPAGKPKIQTAPAKKASFKPIPAKEREPEPKRPIVPAKKGATLECTRHYLDNMTILKMLKVDETTYIEEFIGPAVEKYRQCMETKFGGWYFNYLQKVLYLRDCLFPKRGHREPCELACIFKKDMPCPQRP